MRTMMLDNKWKTGHARGRHGRIAAWIATVGICACTAVPLDAEVYDDFENAALSASRWTGTVLYGTGTQTVTNGQMKIDVTPYGNHAFSFVDSVRTWTLHEGRTLEFRADLMSSNGDGAVGYIGFSLGDGIFAYLLAVDEDTVALHKRSNPIACFLLTNGAPVKVSNVKLVLSMTGVQSSVLLKFRILDNDNAGAVIFEREYWDTALADPMQIGSDNPPQSFLGRTGRLELGLYHDNAGVLDPEVTLPHLGKAEVVFDNAEVFEYYPPLAIRPATLLTWPETPVPCVVEAAPQPAGPWTPLTGDCSEVVGGYHRMYVAPDDQAKCFRSASTLLYKDFTNLSGWSGPDERGTATVTNDDVLLHLNLMSATPFDNMVNWGCAMGPNGYLTMPTNGTLELRCDVVGANQDDAFASLILWRGQAPPLDGYGFSKDQNEITIWKLPRVGLFHAEEVAIKNENITLSLALTPRGSDLEIHARVFDRDNHNALLWEKVVMDTPAADPTVPSGSWKGLVTASDVNPAPYTGTDFVPTIACHYWNAQRAPAAPGAEVTFDSFTIMQYNVPALEVGPAALLSWTEDPVPCRIVETATSLLGPWTTLFTGCTNLVDGHYRTFVPANESARFFRLSEGSMVRIISWPTNISVLEGSNITLRVEATGLDPLSYEWRFNGQVLEGITGNSFTINNAALSDGGAYLVTVSDACGPVPTDPAILKVLVPPTIVEHPQSQTVRVGDTVTFSVSVTNTATLPVGYRWRHYGTTLTNQPLNAYTSTYTINNVQLGDAGDYTVVVTNAAKYPSGYVSDRATLTVGP